MFDTRRFQSIRNYPQPWTTEYTTISAIRVYKTVDEATGEVFVKRVEVKGRLRGQPVRLTTNEWYKAQQLAETYWLYVVWDPLSDSPEIVRIHNPVAMLDHAKREIVAARFYEIPAEAITQCGDCQR